MHLDGGVISGLLPGFHPLEPLDHRLDVTADFTLEGGGPAVVHGGVDGVGARQNGLGVGSLWGKKRGKDLTLSLFPVVGEKTTEQTSVQFAPPDNRLFCHFCLILDINMM